MKIRYVVLVIFLLASVVFARNYNAPQTSTAPTIDGTISPSNEWSDAVQILIQYPDLLFPPREGTVREWTIPPAPNDYSCTVYVKWDSSNLYIRLDVTDDIVDTNEGYDEPQLLFNPLNDANNTYLTEAVVWNLPYNFPINANGGLEPTDSNRAGSLSAGGYMVEANIAWSDFSVTPSVGQVHGIGFSLQDHNAVGDREHYLLDFGHGNFYMSDVTAWNTLTLVASDGLGCGDWGFIKGDVDSDCESNLIDYAEFAQNWLKCTDPNNSDCIYVR